MKESNIASFIGGVVTALLVMLVVIIITDVQVPSKHYTANVCNAVRGEMHGDLCVKDGRVVQIPPMR